MKTSDKTRKQILQEFNQNPHHDLYTSFWEALKNRLKEDLQTDSEAHSWYKHLPLPSFSGNQNGVLTVRMGKPNENNDNNDNTELHFRVQRLDPTTNKNVLVKRNCFWRGVENEGWRHVRNVPDGLDAWWKENYPLEYEQHELHQGWNSSPQLIALFDRERKKTESDVIDHVNLCLLAAFNSISKTFPAFSLIGIHILEYGWPNIIDPTFYYKKF